jgi:hypothetical protein
MDDQARPAEGGAAQPGGGSTAAGELLSDLTRLRRQARSARHAYWFPLVLFGLLICAAAPLYVAADAHLMAGAQSAGVPPVLILGGIPPLGSAALGWYWAAALTGGYLVTVLWYWRHARRAGLRTPWRAYLATGIVLVLAMIVPVLLTRWVHTLGRMWVPLAGIWFRGTVAFLIIAAGLWVLALAERSRGLAVAAGVYTGAALLVSLYNVENVLFDLGWDPGTSQLAWRLTVLPDVLLPAVVLLAAGLGAFLAQHRRQRHA